MRIKKDDPRLIDYVLGELKPRERAAVETAIKKDEHVRLAVEEIRAAVKASAEAFQREPVPALTEEQRRSIRASSSRQPATVRRIERKSRKPVRARIRLVAAVTSGTAIVAAIAVLVVQTYPPRTDRPSLSPDAMRAKQVAAQLPEGWQRFMITDINNAAGSAAVQLDYEDAETQQMIGRIAVRLATEGAPGPARKPAGLPGSLNSPSAFPVRDSIYGLPDDPNLVYWPGHNTETYDQIVDNPFLAVVENPLSTFSIDVDTASYSNVRRFLNQGSLPPKDSVRIEELINYFSYDYEPPHGDDPFAVNVEVATSPWDTDHRLVRIGLKGWEIADEERPATNLVFLLDVSGSMRPVNKLPLLKRAMRMLVDKLGENDSVAIAVYAGASGLVLPSTSCDNKEVILQAIERLESGGSTNGGAGIQLAYDTAVQNFIKGGVNRVILATDGDFNVGVTSQGDLIRLIEDKAKSGVFLSVLGFGMGNYKDSNLEKLADKGNGNYAYIDTINEARKVLVEQIGGTLVTIAKDVKIQIEFNPAEVSAYRLIGYENRIMRAEDFNDDKKDAGEIGAGHTVTALYEVVPAGTAVELRDVDPLRYQQPGSLTDIAATGQIMTLKLRYKEPDGHTSKLLVVDVVDDGGDIDRASTDFRFAASVAAFGMILRDSEHRGTATHDTVLELARNSLGDDEHGYRAEFINLVRTAKALQQ
jgi:Ca-activated chloride channel family protein